MYNIVYKFCDKGAPLCHSLIETVISLNQAERMFKVKRKLKGTLSFVLAMIMVFSLGTAAFAEEADVQPVVCAGSADAEDCAAATHIEGCPKFVKEEPDAEKAEEPAVCAGSAEVEDCAAATHIEGCPKFVKAEPATENESDEKAAVQARINALPESDEFAAMDDAAKQAVADEYAAIMEKLNAICAAEGKASIEELEGIDLTKLTALSAAINDMIAGVAADAAWIGTTGYTTLLDAVTAAKSGDTITLGEGNYTLYGISSAGTTKGKNLTFVGQGRDKTAWNIGAEVPDPAHYGTEYNGDYSFDGAGTITFRNMTLRSGTVDYLGFIRADNTVVDNCTVNGKTFYWGYKSAVFTNTTFNCPSGDYALWTYSSPVMTFDGCTFNAAGKVINVYTDYSAGQHDITINFNNCAVVSSAANKSALNINDSNMGGFKYNININNPSSVSGLNPSRITCSRLFGFSNNGNNTGRSVVSINGTTVWQDGKMVNHAIDCGNVKYTDGYADDVFDITYSEWTETDTARTRTVTKVCRYCGYTETATETENKFALNYDANGGTGTMTPDTCFDGGKLTVKANGFTRDGYDFIGWNTSADGKGTDYAAGDVVEMSDSLTLYAQWEEIITYTVIYTDGVDNAVIFRDQVYSGLEAGDPTPGFVGDPVRRGYKFAGWNPSVSKTVTGDVVYTATWEKTGSGIYNPGKGPKTGDESELALWTVLMLSAGAAAAGVVIYGRKKQSGK